MKLSTLVLTEEESQAGLVEQLINYSLYMSVQGHFWHWQTKSYACHVALGEFYESVTDTADSIAEQYMGCGQTFTGKMNYEILPFSEEVVITKLDEFKKIVLAVETKLMKDENSKFHGVGDTVIDMIKVIDKLKYLLTLK